jgi:hypothetical protein
LGMARRTERHQAVEIEVRAPLGALDDVVDLEDAPAAIAHADKIYRREPGTHVALTWFRTASDRRSPGESHRQQLT